MKDIFKHFTELFQYAKTYKLITVTIKTPFVDFSLAPSIVPQPSSVKAAFYPFLARSRRSIRSS